MSRRTVRPALAAVAVAAVLGVSACGSPLVAGAAAVVGSDRIPIDVLARQVQSGLADPAASQLASDRPAYQRDVLGRLITGQVVQAAADRRGVTVTTGDVDTQYAALESSVGGPDQLRSQAASAGLTLDRVRALARTRALTNALADRLTADVPVSQAQLEQAYQQGADTFDRVRVAQILLPTLADAQALLPAARPLSDAAFADLARARSTDQATRDNGGDLGLQPRSVFVSAGLTDYAQAAFSTPVGGTFAVDSPRGGVVARVLERQTTTLAEATPALRRAILADQRNTTLEDLLTRTSRDLGVRVNPRFGAWDSSTLSVVERTPSGDAEISSPQAPAGGPGVVGGGVPGGQQAPAPAPAPAPAEPTPELLSPPPAAPTP